jgi:hypothetical protein
MYFEKNPRLKIISGGQTGVDRAALEWALSNGIPHGGWCPKGRKAEDGVIASQFQLTETGSENYFVRTRWNVRDADGTVIFSQNRKLTGGTRQTAEFAKQHGKPLLHLIPTLGANKAARQLERFLEEHGVAVLNVAGPRASEQPEIREFVKAVLSRALRSFLSESAIHPHNRSD